MATKDSSLSDSAPDPPLNAPDPPLEEGERVVITHVVDSTNPVRHYLEATGTVREWRGREVLVDCDHGALARVKPRTCVREEVREKQIEEAEENDSGSWWPF